MITIKTMITTKGVSESECLFLLSNRYLKPSFTTKFKKIMENSTKGLTPPGPTFVGHTGTCAQAHSFTFWAARHIWLQVTSTYLFKIYQATLMFNHMYMIIVVLSRTSIRHLYQTDFVMNWLLFVSKSGRWYSIFRYIMRIALVDFSIFNNKNLKPLVVWMWVLIDIIVITEWAAVTMQISPKL